MQSRFDYCGALVAAGLALVLAGCSNLDLDSSTWFSKPVDFFGRSSGYTYSELRESNRKSPLSPSDLVDANGNCPPPAAAAPPPPQVASNNPAPPPPVSYDPNELTGGVVALGMSECDVVRRAGRPNDVRLGGRPDGTRSLTLTYYNGPRPGIYTFESGRLMEMGGVNESLRQRL